jgi:hypothetical protein
MKAVQASYFTEVRFSTSRFFSQRFCVGKYPLTKTIFACSCLTGKSKQSLSSTKKAIFVA